MAEQKEDLKVWYCFLSSAKESPLRKKKYFCYLFDISLKGVGLLSDSVFNIGSIIYMRINHRALSLKKDLVSKGRVVRICPYGNKFIIGVEFIDISQANKKIIGDFISHYLYERKKRFVSDDTAR